MVVLAPFLTATPYSSIFPPFFRILYRSSTSNSNPFVTQLTGRKDFLNILIPGWLSVKPNPNRRVTMKFQILPYNLLFAPSFTLLKPVSFHLEAITQSQTESFAIIFFRSWAANDMSASINPAYSCDADFNPSATAPPFPSFSGNSRTLTPFKFLARFAVSSVHPLHTTIISAFFSSSRSSAILCAMVVSALYAGITSETFGIIHDSFLQYLSRFSVFDVVIWQMTELFGQNSVF